MAAYRATVTIPPFLAAVPNVATAVSNGTTERIRIQTFGRDVYLLATAANVAPTSIAGALLLKGNDALPGVYKTGDSFPDLGDVAAYWWAVAIDGGSVSVSHA